MQTDPVAEWQRLTGHYRTLTDDQLEDLAIDFADLTETAQQILRGEMRTRGLRDPQSPRNRQALMETQRSVDRRAAPPPDAGLNPDLGEDRPQEYTWKTLLCECDTREEAWQVSEVLRRAGIASWTAAPGMYSPYADLDLTSPRVLVAADQIDEARSVASRPIPQDVIDESKIAVPDFQPPRCPACGAADPLLEDVEPVNAWRCALCGRQWNDSEPSKIPS
jgi:hypothetical protein